MSYDVESDAAFASFLPGAKQDDRTCYAIFKVDKKLIGHLSHAAGRPIYEDREYVSIMVKGQDKQIFWREVTNEDRNRFPNAYQSFQKGVSAPAIGTPIEMLGLGPSTVESLKQKGVRTVEDLAELGDAALQSVGLGAREMKDRAKAFLNKSSETTTKLQAENDALKAQLADLAAKVDALASQSPAPPKRGPGRPPKQERVQ